MSIGTKGSTLYAKEPVQNMTNLTFVFSILCFLLWWKNREAQDQNHVID